jgi:hypothetical protein
MLRSGPRNGFDEALPIKIRSAQEQQLARLMFKDFVSFTSHRWQHNMWKTFSEEEVIRDWSKLELSDCPTMADNGKYGRIRACEQLGCFWTDTKKTFSIIALIEPEFAIAADAIGFTYAYNPIQPDAEKYCDTENILKIIYKEFVQYQVDVSSDRFLASNADTVVRDWMKENAESKYYLVQESGDLNSLFCDDRLVNILVDLLQVEFEIAEVGMLQRYNIAVEDGTGSDFYPKRCKPPSDLLYTEFVLSFLGVERFNVEQEKQMLIVWETWGLDARRKEVGKNYQCMTNDDLPISEIVQLLIPEFDSRINRIIPPTDDTCMGIHKPPWMLCMAEK